MIHPDTDQERELIAAMLRKANLVRRSKQIQLEQPYRLTNRAFGGHLNTDGKMAILWLKQKKLKLN